MTIGEEQLLDERRGRRRAGDPRITPEGREILRRITRGDLADEFQAALDADLANDRCSAVTTPTTEAPTPCW